jgi:hypothetical protein
MNNQESDHIRLFDVKSMFPKFYGNKKTPAYVARILKKIVEPRV